MVGGLGFGEGRALDSRWAGREFDSHTAAALSGNNFWQVVHTNVPLFTKQYNLVPCEGSYAWRCL